MAVVAEGESDFSRQLTLFRRRLWLLIGVGVGSAVIGLAILWILPRSYRADADILLDPRQQRVVDVQQVLSGLPVDASAVETEVEILRSRGLADRVVQALGLDKTTDAATSTAARARAVDRLLAHLKIRREGLTNLISIGVDDRDPTRAAAIANTLSRLYLADQLDTKAAATRRASGLLGARLGGLRQQVETAEAAVERYKAAHGLAALGDDQGATATQQVISALDVQMASAESDRAQADAQYAVVAQAKGAAPEALSSPVIQALRKQKAEASARLADLEGRYGPRYPAVIDAHRQLADIDAGVKDELVRVSAGLAAEADAAHRREAALKTRLAGYQAELASANAASVRLNELERNATAVRTLYEAYLDRFRQTVSQDGMAQSDARIVSLAKPPLHPSFPSLPMGLAVIAAISGLAGLLAVWGAEAWEDGLYALDEVERRLGLKALAAIPRSRLKDAGGHMPLTAALLDDPHTPFADGVRALAMALGGGADRRRVIAVTSALAGEGKTVTCVALGHALAQTGRRTVVIDADLRRRGLGRAFDRAPATGLMEVLDGAPLDSALIRDPLTGLAFLPVSGGGRLGEEAFAQPTMERLLAELRRRFDVVLIDTAPALPVAATRMLASRADGVVLLTRWGRTRVGAVRQAAQALEAAGGDLLGVVLTQVGSAGAYGYGYYPPYRAIPAMTAA